jgi:hypothetical protein
VNVPLSLLPDRKIPVTDLNTLPAVIEPYAVTIIHEQAVRFVQPADRAPNAGAFGANWAICTAPTSVCQEEDDASINYSDGWHTVKGSDASGGQFRFHAGKSPAHFAAITLDVAAGQSGKFTYHYATSPKGGSAEIFIDGVSKGTISYAGSQGSTRAPEFGKKIEFADLGPGQHTIELKNLKDAVYIDRFCLESAATNGSAASGPGETTASNSNLNLGQQVSKQVPIDATATSISIFAETANNLPIKLLLIDPAGSILTTADNSSGFAVIDAPVSILGTYVVKVVNLSVGPVQVWTATTPTMKR